MSVQIKETKNLDYEKVVDIFFAVKFLAHPEKRATYKEALEKAFRNSDYVVSAWNKDNLIGFARVTTDKTLFATIWNMIVLPVFQNQGIGRKLLQKCLARYPNLHFFLFAGEQNFEFYQKNGFDRHPHGMHLLERRKVCVIYN